MCRPISSNQPKRSHRLVNEKDQTKRKTVTETMFEIFLALSHSCFLYEKGYMSPPQFSPYKEEAAMISDSRDAGMAVQREQKG